MNPSEIFESLAILNSQLRLEHLIPTVLDVSLKLTGGDRAFLMLCEEEGSFVFKSGRNKSRKDLAEETFSGSTTVISKVVEEQQPLYIPRVGENAEISDAASVQKMHLKSVVCIPLFHHGQRQGLLGVLYIDSASLTHPLKEEHLQIMQMMANHVAISLENAGLFEQVEQKNLLIEQLNVQLAQRMEVQASNLAEMRSLLEEKERELGRSYGVGGIVGKSKAMMKVFRVLEKVVRTHATVLILGETGTGKEMIAKHIHYAGPRAEKPMISVNCSAFSETLLESELFGHRKGAFTGATENKMGLFQIADEGTLFLDEVGDMSSEMQKKLLRVLQEGEIRPIGSKDIARVNVRIIAATNRTLEEMVKKNEFRQDLYFRLNVISIQLPPIRDRREDIPLLVEFFTNKVSQELKQPSHALPADVMKNFLQSDWPGNVRQLENEIRRAIILESEYEFGPLNQSSESDMKMSSIEKNAILKALESTAGNKTKAAETLGMSRSAFYEKLSKYNIN